MAWRSTRGGALSSAHICRAWAAPGLVSFDIAWVGFGCLQPDPLLGWSSGGITTYSPQRARLRGDMNFGDARTGDPGVEVGDAGEGDLATSTGALWLELSMVGSRGSWRVSCTIIAVTQGSTGCGRPHHCHYWHTFIVGYSVYPWREGWVPFRFFAVLFFFSFRFLISTAMHIPPSFGQAFFFYLFIYQKHLEGGTVLTHCHTAFLLRRRRRRRR